MATAKPPVTPAIAVWALRIGGGAALACGALLSFVALYRLGLANGWPAYAAWAFPVSVDVLAATAVVVAMSVPREHSASAIAHWCAGIALAMTVGCNVEYHALLPATHWSPGHVALVATGAAPALVVELIIVMQMYLGDGATLVAQDTTTATKGAAKRDAIATTTRPAVAPLPGAPVARPETPATPTPAPAAPETRDATTPAAPSRLPDEKERKERDRTILALIARHGRPDKARGIKGVTGPMVGVALGVHRANGTKALTSVLERIDRGELTVPELEDEPERVLAVAR